MESMRLYQQVVNGASAGKQLATFISTSLAGISQPLRKIPFCTFARAISAKRRISAPSLRLSATWDGKSGITMTTFGNFDLLPKTDLAAIVLPFHSTVGLFMTLLSLARFISLLPIPKSSEAGEN